MSIEALARQVASTEQRIPRNDLDRAYMALSGKQRGYNTLWDYYDGDQPLMYTARRMRDLFADLDLATFVENWCAVVIDAAADRIILESLTTENVEANKLLADNWVDLNIPLEVGDTHEAALVIGESFVIVWKGEGEEEGGEEELQVFYQDPRLCHMFYERSNPKKKRYAAKWWKTEDAHTRITLYYPDLLEHWQTRTPNKQITDYRSFERFNPTGEDSGATSTNPFGEIPMFHFRLERRKVKSDLTNAIPLQNGVNKLNTDMMVAAEFGAFKQRWIISNSDTSALKNAPWIIWEIAAGDGVGQESKVGEFDATELENYIKGMNKLSSSLATITRTPRHYLFGHGGGELSGEALIAMEAPLNKRCAEHIAQFTPVWKDVARFMLKVQDVPIDRKDIVPTFARPETVQPKTQAETRQLGKSAGIPLKTLLRDEGKDDVWMEQMEADKKEEQDAQPMLTILDGIRNQRTTAEGDGG